MADVLTEVRNRRGPATRIVIGLVVAWALLGVAQGVIAVLNGLDVLTAVWSHAQSLYSVPVLLVLVLTVVAAVWVRPRLPNAVGLARAATVVASVVVGLAIVGGIVGLWSPGLQGSQRALAVADLVVSSVVPVLLCVALATMAGAVRRAQDLAPAVTATAAPDQTSGGTPDPEVTGTAEEQTETAPTWEPGAAAGAAWTSAADAAGGGQAAWGDDRTDSGWQQGRGQLGSGGLEGAGADGDPGGTGRTTAGRLDRSLWDATPHDPE